jgi:hypothetical protein
MDRSISADDVTEDPSVQPCTLAAKGTHWVAIELVGEDDRPVPWEAYEVTLPGGDKVSGFLDSDGKARVEGPDSGSCVVCFPDLDAAAWERYPKAPQSGGASA